MMMLRCLDDQELTRLYREHVCRDFPPMERRPLRTMLALRRQGCYAAYVLAAGEETVAYAMVAGDAQGRLLDYLAVVPDQRNRGLGSYMLGALARREEGMLLTEVEDPGEVEGTPRELRLRRIRFYEKNRFQDTGLRVRVYGVAYRILVRDAQGSPRETLECIYRRLFTPSIYRSQVQFLRCGHREEPVSYGAGP